MIRRGKEQGWLRSSPASLWALSASYGVDFGPCQVTDIAVPRDLVLSRETVLLHAKSDRHLRQVLEAVGEWGMTTRHAVLVFLLVQVTHACPGLSETIGVSGPFSEYVKSLPLEHLPTVWTDEQVALTQGTTLKPALDAKMGSLYREFCELRAATMCIAWCQREWWDEVDGMLQLDDWRQVDAMYRSRALEFPGIGDCMIPCIDIANHAAGDKTVARYEASRDGDALLLLVEGQQLRPGGEITISYGDDKGACEMIFSYGFLDEDMISAQTLFLDVDMADDDPLKRAKKHVANSAPGVRLSENSMGIVWESEYIWLVVVNEEDGLSFEVLQTVDGERQLQVSWGGEAMADVSQLSERLRGHKLWPVFHLRAVAMIQERIARQIEVLVETSKEREALAPGSSDSGGGPLSLASRLSVLEGELLDKGHEHMEAEKRRLADDGVVRDFLGQAAEGDSGTDEDFS